MNLELGPIDIVLGADVLEIMKTPLPRYMRQRFPFHPGKMALKAVPEPWRDGYDFRRPHPFLAHDAVAGSQCGRCWGWVDDPRHMFHPTE